ncbi:uncharacterized protein LOC106669019 [Cimex lectularius]|uniref:Uncharacterized protein n=1 Tax=Cimex lectularius TaxID=79782 RepID=A0A8I6RXZ3_CIMLE|nr:uncharacterized protein LOC106669019 [Cimex lectularius]
MQMTPKSSKHPRSSPGSSSPDFHSCVKAPKMSLTAASSDLNTLKKSIDRIFEEIKTLKNENMELRNEVARLTEVDRRRDRQVEALDNFCRRNNSIFYGISYKSDDNLEEIVGSFMAEVLQLSKSFEIAAVKPLNRINGKYLNLPQD